jgi:hypothetical protein
MADGYALATTVVVAGSDIGRNFDMGQRVRVNAVFTTSLGTAADPAVVKFSCRAQALGFTTTLVHGTDASLEKHSTGTYSVDIDTTESGGLWDWKFYSTGTGAAADSDQFYVRPTVAV